MARPRAFGYFHAMRKKAVVMDDDPYFRELLERVLAAAFEVRGARDGMEGLRACRDEAPDVVLLDMFMPGLNGDAVVAALGRDPRTEALPIVAFSAARLDTAQRAAFIGRHGVRALLDKLQPPRAFLEAALSAVVD